MIEYKYPELVKPFTLHGVPQMTAEYNMLIPALGIVKLQRVINYVFNEYTWPSPTLEIIVKAMNQCTKEFDAAQAEYADV
jgi:hypothetical protein